MKKTPNTTSPDEMRLNLNTLLTMASEIDERWYTNRQRLRPLPMIVMIQVSQIADGVTRNCELLNEHACIGLAALDDGNPKKARRFEMKCNGILTSIIEAENSVERLIRNASETMRAAS
jgi:hypothetical protein